MIIDLATINFAGGGSGGGDTPTIQLQEKTVGITTNGITVITPDAGYGGMYEVEVNVDVPTQGGGTSSGIDFNVIGYSAQLSNELNSVWNNEVAYSKTLYDAWDPANTSAESLYQNNEQLIYAPNIDTSNVTTMLRMFYGCTALTVVPTLDTSNATDLGSMFYSCSSLKSIPQFDTSAASNMSTMFSVCTSLSTIPLLDTSNVTTMSSMFRGCTSLTTIPLLDTSKLTNMYGMFYGCTGLTALPLLDTSNVTDMNSAFYECKSITTIPAFNTSNVTNMRSMLVYCNSLVSVPLLDASKVTNISNMFGYLENPTVTDLGGFKDLKVDWSDMYSLAKLPNLTYQSVMNVINNLYDFRANGDSTTTRTIRFNANSLALLSDADKTIATNKGWILA